jgi:hypothetical protein
VFSGICKYREASNTEYSGTSRTLGSRVQLLQVSTFGSLPPTILIRGPEPFNQGTSKNGSYPAEASPAFFVYAPYQERFLVGTGVRVAPRQQLEQFKETWRFHHPLTRDQLRSRKGQATVREVAFYHGGDVLYTWDGIPGTWHEHVWSRSSNSRSSTRSLEAC